LTATRITGATIKTSVLSALVNVGGDAGWARLTSNHVHIMNMVAADGIAAKKASYSKGSN
jgi:hypothetical protein